MFARVKKALQYNSAIHQELLNSVKAIGLEMPRGFSAHSDGEKVRFKGWILPHQPEDKIEWVVEKNGNAIGSQKIEINRPDVLLHYKIEASLSKYQGFDFLIDTGLFDKVLLKVNSFLFLVWTVTDFNGVPEKLISPATKEFRELHRTPNQASVEAQNNIVICDDNAVPSDFVNLSVDEFIAYFSSKPNFISNATSVINALRAPDWASSFIKEGIKDSSKFSIPGFFSNSPTYCRFSVTFIDFNFICFSNELECYYLVQHCNNICLIFPEHLIVADLTNAHTLPVAAKEKLNELSQTVRKFKNNLPIQEDSEFGGLLISQSRPYHYFYDYLFGVNFLSKSIDKKFDMYGVCGFDFFDLSYFDNCLSYESTQSEELNNKCIGGKSFLLMPCFQYIYSSYDRGLNELSSKLIKIAEKASSVKVHDSKISAADLIVWVGLCDEKRSWLEQLDGLSTIISQLNIKYKNLCVLVDGRTFPLTPRKADYANKSREDILFEKLVFRNPSVNFINMIGLKSVDKIYLAEKIDLFISNYGTDSIYPSAICGKPGVVYAATSIGSQRSFVVHKNIIEVPSQKITDVAPRAGKSDSWHETSISMDWRDVYECVLQLIEKYKIH